jgi:alcohol dehydrogenase class IV
VSPNFVWRDAGRTVVFRDGGLRDAPQLLAEHGFEPFDLLSSERHLAGAAELAGAAATVHRVPVATSPATGVTEAAAALLDRVAGRNLVAFGGGRVVDTAKAIGGATGRPAGAIPTTLSAAEMTKIHRTPAGAQEAKRVRPAFVLNDPALCASQPPVELAASAANSLAHAVEAQCTTLASPVPTLAAREAARLIDAAYAGEIEDVNRDQLALAALLSGYAIDAAWYGLSHVMSQTLVRVGGAAHGPANAALLPHTIAALERRRPGYVDPDDSLRQLARTLARLAAADGIRSLGVARERLADCARAAAQRPELDLTPPRADEAELLELYEGAW